MGEHNIADMWQTHFRKIYNSCSNTTHRDKLYAKVKCEQHMNNVVNLHVVSVYDIMAAMSELQTGIAVGPHGIPAEAFLYGGQSVGCPSLWFFFQILLLLTVCIYFFSQLLFPILRTMLASCLM